MSNMRFAVIGAGMSGILAAIKLRESGQGEVTVFEKADRIGGTWRDNVYPGLSCDVPAHNYTYSFAFNPEWSGYYAPGAEIQAYFERVVRDHGIGDAIRFGSEVIACRWTGDRWRIELADGCTSDAEVIIAATGVLHHPRWPEIPGLADFAGTAMHTARWNPDEPLKGKRIGIVGSGSTGIQMATRLGLDGHDVVHFQRSPQWIMPVPDHVYTPEQRERFRRDPAAIEALRNDEQYWSNVHRFNDAIVDPDSPAMAEIEEYCRVNLEQSVHDPELRERLRPDYRAACKRLIYSSSYYQAAQLANVETVTCGIERIVPDGILDRDNRHHRLDILALATGFHADRFLRPMIVEGTGGMDLEQTWHERCSAYLGVTMPHFPNLFMLNGPTSPVGNFSLIDVAEMQWRYIERLLEPIVNRSASAVCVSETAFADYERRRIDAARQTIFASGCSSWYLDDQGVPMTWPWPYKAFEQATAAPDWSEFDVA